MSPDVSGDVLDRVIRRVHGLRSRVAKRSGGVYVWRAGIALVGLVVIIVGVVLLVLPGPGWVIIFVGLGIWATEFAWAASLMKSVRRLLRECTAWFKRHRPRWLY
jgi:uncharacterized protein (TIGR02611 family)